MRAEGEWCHALIALVHMHALRLGLCFCSMRIRSLITAAAAIEQIHDDGRQADRQAGPFFVHSHGKNNAHNDFD